MQLIGIVGNAVMFIYLWQYKNLPTSKTQSTRDWISPKSMNNHESAMIIMIFYINNTN